MKKPSENMPKPEMPGELDALLSNQNENLLSQCKFYWFYGDWESLVNLEVEQLQEHSDRAKIVLLVASAYQQLSDFEAAETYCRKALDWGCEPKAVAKVCIAGAYNILGRIAAIQDDQEKIESAFLESVDIGDRKDLELIAHSRAVREMAKLGLLPQAANLIGKLQLDSSKYDVNKNKILAIEVDWIRDKISQIQRKQAQDSSTEVISHAPADSALSTSKSNTKKYYGLNKLDEKLETYLDYDEGFYVEIGANDGLNQSNTAYFEKSRRWRGVLIEPILHNFLACQKNRSPINFIVCSACVSFSYNKDHLKLHYANLMTAAEGVESDIEDPKAHADSGKIYNQCDTSTEIVVTAKTMDSILDEANAPKVIDLLSLDVEGAEIEVLKGINHDKYRFKYILVECRDIEHMTDVMKTMDYAFTEKLSVHDYLFKNQRTL